MVRGRGCVVAAPARTASPSGSGTRSRRAGGRRCRARACRCRASCAASSRRAAAGGRTGTASRPGRSGCRRRPAARRTPRTGRARTPRGRSRSTSARRWCEVAGGHRLAPRRGEAGGDRAGEGLVLARLDHVDRLVVLAHGGGAELQRWTAEAGVVAQPLPLVVEPGVVERAAAPRRRRPTRPACWVVPNPSARSTVPVARQRHAGGERHVPVRRGCVRGQRPGRVEHVQAVAGRIRVADARGREAARRLERHVGREPRSRG